MINGGGDINGESKGRKPRKKGETRKGGKREKGGGIVTNTHTHNHVVSRELREAHM